MKCPYMASPTQTAATLVGGEALAPRLEDLRRRHCRLVTTQIDVDPFGDDDDDEDAAAAAWPMKVAPLDQKLMRDRRWPAWRRLRGGRRWRAAVVLPLTLKMAEEEEVAEMEAPGLLNVLVNMKAPLVNSPPVAGERRCEPRSHKQGL